MSRIDFSDYLIHFTKSKGRNQDIDMFCKIYSESQILCGTGFVKKEECCICFTEAPISCLIGGESSYFNRYGAFGFLFKKEYIFGLGGRPVIYSEEKDYYLLLDELKY